MNTSDTTRYAININNEDMVLVYASDSEMQNTKNIPHNNGYPIYINILAILNLSYKVKMYFVNGDVITGFIARKPYNPIKLTNMDSLFDGRFNS